MRDIGQSHLKMQKSITRGLIAAMLPFICASAFAQINGSTSADPKAIGRAVVVVGHATLLDAHGSTPLTRDAAIMPGDTIDTGSDGYVYITTVDQGFISVRPDSSLSVDRYDYDAAAPSRTVIKLTLHNGVVREISGKGAQAAREHYRMNTPVAALGVRGTDFSVFTDANVTRADVRSGGIVMTPLGGDCTVAGLGPCEGPAAAQLFTNQLHTLLQVDRGSARPIVIDAKLTQLIPDQAIPPLKSEDSAASAATVQPPVAPGVAPAELTFPLTLPTTPSTPTAPVTPVTPPTTPVTPVTPVTPESQQIFWGRFAPLALMPATTTLTALLQQGSEQVGTVLPYALVRTPQTDMVMPQLGAFNFTLQSYEAFVTNTLAGTASAATINNALLSIDFGARTFATSFNLNANNVTYAISGQGSVSSNGQLFSSYTSPAIVQGALAGNTATQAGYVFTQGLSGNNTAVGATLWSR